MDVPTLKVCVHCYTELTPYLLVGHTLMGEQVNYNPARPMCPPCMVKSLNNLVIMDLGGESLDPSVLYTNWLLRVVDFKNDMGGA